MDEERTFGRPWWDIATLLRWIGKDEAVGLADIEQAAVRGQLQITGHLGWPGFGRLAPRAAIPALEFADCSLKRAEGQCALLLDDPERGASPAGWYWLKAQADEARAIWSDAKPNESYPDSMPDIEERLAPPKPASERSIHDAIGAESRGAPTGALIPLWADQPISADTAPRFSTVRCGRLRGRAMEKPIPIVDAIDAVATRLGATAEQAWADIKSKAFYDRLSLEGLDERGRRCTIEPHWISYIESWGTDDPPPSTVPGKRPATSDMPKRDSGSMIAFDRARAYRDRRADEGDGRELRAIPPARVRAVEADGEQLENLWARAEHESKSPDWSLGNVLSWIAFHDPVLIYKFESRHDLAALRLYVHSGSSPLPPLQMLVSQPDQALLDALKGGRLTAIGNGADMPSTYWFGKYVSDLTQDLRFRRSEVMAIDWWPAKAGDFVSDPTAPLRGALIPLGAAIEPNSGLMEIIEAAWQAGAVTLWGRRKGHAMPEPIRRYQGLVIEWMGGEPKGAYYAEASAAPRMFGAGYHRHEWEELAIPADGLIKLSASVKGDSTLRRPDIAATIKARDSVALHAEAGETARAPDPVQPSEPEPWSWHQAVVWAMWRDDELVALLGQDTRRYAERAADRIRAGLRQVGGEQELRALLRSGRITARGQKDGANGVEPVAAEGWPEWEGTPPGWSKDEITFDAAEMRRVLLYVPEAERPLDLIKDPDWIVENEGRRARRQKQLDRFRECQHRRRQWLSFEEIADWCARVSGTVRRDEALRAQAYADLRDAMLAGLFGQAARSLVMYLRPAPGSVDGRLRLTPDGLRTWLDLYGADDPVITTEILSRCWLPRDLCRRWFERQGLTWPSAFDPPDVLGAVPPSTATSPTASAVLLPGPKGGETSAAAIAWEIAEQILKDETKRPPRGHGRLTALARAVQPLLKARGLSRELDTITKDIRRSLREWEAKSPDD